MKNFNMEFMHTVLKNQRVLIPALSNLQKNGLLERERAELLLLQYKQIKVNFDSLMTGNERECIGVSWARKAGFGRASSICLYHTTPRSRHGGVSWGCPASSSVQSRGHRRASRNSRHNKRGKQGTGGKASRGRKKLSKSDEQLLLARLAAVITIIEFLMGSCSEIRDSGSSGVQQGTAVQQIEAIGELSDAIEELNKTICEMNEKK